VKSLTKAQADRLVELFSDAEDVSMDAQAGLVEMMSGPVSACSLRNEANKFLQGLLDSAREIQTIICKEES